jgi:hypothetical protein
LLTFLWFACEEEFLKKKRGKMKIFKLGILLVLIALVEARPFKFDVPLVDVTPAVYTKATENLESSTEDSAYWEIASLDDDLALRSSVSSFKGGFLNFVPTLTPLIVEINSSTIVAPTPYSSAFKDDHVFANDTFAFEFNPPANDSRVPELEFKMEAITLSPWEVVKLLWNSVDTPAAVGAALFVGKYC